MDFPDERGADATEDNLENQSASQSADAIHPDDTDSITDTVKMESVAHTEEVTDAADIAATAATADMERAMDTVATMDTENIADAESVTDTVDATDAESVTDAIDTTDTGSAADIESVADSADVEDTESVTDSADVKDTGYVTDAESVTDTEAVVDTLESDLDEEIDDSQDTVEIATQKLTSNTPSRQVAESPDAPVSDAHPGMLGEGDGIGQFVVVRPLGSAPNEASYYVRLAGMEDSGRYLLLERPLGGFGSATQIARLDLRHPRLLAPREFLTHDGLDYLVLETLTGPDDTLAPSVASGATLSHRAALSAGTGLADALAYLHRNEVAHLHVSPDTIRIYEERAYLAGMEDAIYLSDNSADRTSLFGRDANFLARTLGMLAGLENDGQRADVEEHDTMARTILEIVEHGQAGAFTNVEEVAAVCAGSLRTGPAVRLETEPGTERLSFVTGFATTVGRVRSENQDACAVMQLDVHDDVSGAIPLGVFLVADGMGGEARGELASRIATRSMVAELAGQLAYREQTDIAAEALDVVPLDEETPDTPTVLQNALLRAVEEANRRVRGLAMRIAQTTGTTLTALAAMGGYAALAHVGDSRAYLMRNGRMDVLTEDHSILARLQAIDHPVLSDPDVFVPRNMLYRSLGQEDDAGPDLLAFALFPDDRLLICSDGLWDELDDATIAEILANAPNPRAGAEELVRAANASGGNDNSTAVVVFVGVSPDIEVDEHAGDSDVRDTFTGVSMTEDA